MDLRPLIFTADMKDIENLLLVNQVAKILYHPEAEAYIFIIRKETKLELNITLINFIFNKLFTRR